MSTQNALNCIKRKPKFRNLAFAPPLLLSMMMILLGCGGEETDTTTDECSTGTKGCECAPGDICFSGFECIDSICVEEACNTGEIGCYCYTNDSCDPGLTCDTDICVEETCPAGIEGCECYENQSCDSGLVCVDDACEVYTCPAGDVGCECDEDGSCGDGMLCIDHVCKEINCTIGEENCNCQPDGTCDGLLSCIGGYCTLDCTIGELNCACDEDGGCTSDEWERQLLCSDGVCLTPECPEGDLGCECLEDGSCTGEDLVCDTSEELPRCLNRDCSDFGTDQCPCRSDRSCEADLACVLGECIPLGECEMGADGCPCFRNGSCDDGYTCDPHTEYCVEIGCTPGSIGCECDDGSCTGGNAICTSGMCEVENCSAGNEGCECLDGACGVNFRSEQLICDSGICRSDSCNPGEIGCACRNGEECDENSAVCTNGFCMAEECLSGELNCSCSSSACSSGLVCRSESICIDGSGFLGGPCYDNGLCERGNRCSEGVCVPCYLGTNNCACNDSGECSRGLQCVSDICTSEDLIIATIPDPPVCYTPCLEDIQNEDTYITCPSDNLMDGCVGDLVCTDGSCVLPDEDPATCDTDAECPDFQACMEGQCYSNCELNSDCGGDYECYRHVCRMPCSASEESCPDGTYCSLIDTVNGYCLPLIESSDVQQTSIDGSFEVDLEVVALSNVDTSTDFVISNNSPYYEEFIVRKLEHQMFSADGTSDTTIDHYGDDEDCDLNTNCPLFWIEFGEQGGDLTFGRDFIVGLDPGEEKRVLVRNAGGSSAVSWNGTVQIVHEGNLGTSQISFVYAERPEGQWRGTAYYYSTFNETNLADWAENLATRDNANLQTRVGNAFIQRWGAFRSGRISWDEMQAVMTASESGSWKSASALSVCRQEACYLYDGWPTGVGDYSSDLEDDPVPTGVTELPFAMNLRMPSPNSDPSLMEGRIESSGTLHYAGNPAITLRLHSNFDDCDLEEYGACLNYVEEFGATIHIGGRYSSDPSNTNCTERDGGTYTNFTTPWLLPGFARDTYSNDAGLYRYECRNSTIPFDVDESDNPELTAAYNMSLASSNPIPDGLRRKRTLALLDGALINQSTLVIIFKEEMKSFMDPEAEEGITAYGYLVLTKETADLENTDLNGNQIIDAFEGTTYEDTEDLESLLELTCSDDLLEEALEFGQSLNADTAGSVVTALINGYLPGASETLAYDDNEQVHYYCEDTGYFDGGPDNSTPHGIELSTRNNSCETARDNICQDGGPDSMSSECELGTDYTDCGIRYTDDEDERDPCPVGSKVIFFTVDSSVMSQADIANEDCQEDRSCMDTLTDWKSAVDPMIQIDPIFKCTSGGVYCESNRYNLRDGKEFFAVTEGEALFTSFRSELSSAFRYKVRFRNRSGTSVGFAPEICITDSDQIPYCYDPSEIEGLRERVDCLLLIWDEFYPDMMTSGDPNTEDALDILDEFLVFNFSYEEDCINNDPNRCTTIDGFEKLYAELLIMMGDESYTTAFASRFDLANSNTVSFDGEYFEENGINLSGAAGYEMYSLYQAIQYYQEGLDRFYNLSPTFWLAVQEDLDEQSNPDDDHRMSFVTPETVTWYMDRLIRASTQKSRTWSEIAERYMGFNRPDLSRVVVERAYTMTYLESVVFSRIMLRIRDVFPESDQALIQSVLDEGQIRYRMAMLDMRNVYSSISDETTFYGIAPDYIPLATLNQREENAFEKLLQRTWQRVEIAQAREDAALQSDRAYETDAAQFQSELTRIRTTYESQLGDLCGTFIADDNRVYPAIMKYADKTHKTSVLGDPCGLIGNGQIHQAMAQIDLISVDTQKLLTQYSGVYSRIEYEKIRVDEQCELIDGLASFVLCAEIGEECELVPDDEELSGNVLSIENMIREARFVQQEAQRAFELMRTVATLTKCTFIAGTTSGGDCATSIFARVMFGLAAVANEATQAYFQIRIDDAEAEITEIRAYIGAYQTRHQCDQLEVDSTARVKEMMLELKELNIEMLRVQYQFQLALSEIQRYHNMATRLQMEMEEVEQMAINVEAARNNPNIRLYRNDAIINAEITFEDALRQVYRVTRVFEYYTSQSYAEIDQLYLIRMVSYGDYNLQNYLIQLENAFYEFEETYGLPDTRVQKLSLKNDLLYVPWVDDEGRSYTSTERTEKMREKLLDPSLLNRDGYLTIRFSTDTDTLSPLTRNHKVYYIEADMTGTDLGDSTGRIYLRQVGTGVVHTVNDDTQYYRFPERTAVIDNFFNGVRFFDPEVYKTFRMRDLPYANTAWELIINQRDEVANQDINLQNLTDIKIYVYYTDFTIY